MQGEATAERANSTDIRRDHPCKEYSGAGVRTSRVDIFNYALRLSKMKFLVALVVMGVVSAARLEHLQQQGGYGGSGTPFRFENVNNGDGSYRYSYDTPTGISAYESGAPRAPGPEGPAVTAEGGFSFRTVDGQQISLTYTADENGFHPVGSHLPTPPPIPEAILRSIEFNRQNPSSDNGSNGGRNGYRY